jgi:hypothetical protein
VFDAARGRVLARNPDLPARPRECRFSEPLRNRATEAFALAVPWADVGRFFRAPRILLRAEWFWPIQKREHEL